ncbi:hypothetical protein GNI_039390 [Gregarina niphandrodes]|uniref:Uncharacterized protein n=1 Tax=Gregarina niphandrodes TaxID=110365 RepID=A0A023BAD9_GRENI|nr:hypothetical protein GNI_039390 [Gregarina niphandrodes]EZG78236.1 hypothetical protein GNI_039390 [Gregarina niphandrodes]|eukprot:XP_011129386.1 hypothetical protein GNI_039390 [Gregarina niphandrodes]
MQKLLAKSLQREIELTKQKVIDKALEVQGLMNMYHMLRPDRALQLLAQYPQVFATACGDGENKDTEELIRAATRSLQVAGDAPLGKEKALECIHIYNQLIEKKLITVEQAVPVVAHQVHPLSR